MYIVYCTVYIPYIMYLYPIEYQGFPVNSMGMQESSTVYTIYCIHYIMYTVYCTIYTE